MCVVFLLTLSRSILLLCFMVSSLEIRGVRVYWWLWNSKRMANYKPQALNHVSFLLLSWNSFKSMRTNKPALKQSLTCGHWQPSFNLPFVQWDQSISPRPWKDKWTDKTAPRRWICLAQPPASLESSQAWASQVSPAVCTKKDGKEGGRGLSPLLRQQMTAVWISAAVVE